jgi:hypothetical protein
MNKAHSRYGEGPSSRQTEPADYRMIFSYQIRKTRLKRPTTAKTTLKTTIPTTPESRHITIFVPG